MKSLLALFLLSLSVFATTHDAKVLESLNSGGYTYIKVKEAEKRYWIAMTERKVKVGEQIKYNEQGWMQNFHSKTLNRTFDKILFASDASVAPVKQKKVQKSDVMDSKYLQAGTITISELFAHREKYAGKSVRIRGVVTKSSMQIMKHNWVHLQDGSRFRGADDLVFTTVSATPKVGDVVVAEGQVTLDKDFGYGYFYSVIVEKTSFSK